MERYCQSNLKRIPVNMKKVGVIGIMGIPAKYGGFETLVDNIIGCKSGKIEYTVYCSKKNYTSEERQTTYKGAKLEYIGFKANGVQSIFYDIISIYKSVRHLDVLLILGVSGCIILPFLRFFTKKRIIVNIDGLEHKRDKWGKYVRKFLKYSEKLAVLYSDVIIADNKAIQDYVKEEYQKEAELIAYGGDHVLGDYGLDSGKILNRYKLDENGYCLALCRIEPENNVRMILDAFIGSNQKIVFIGNWNKSDYARKLYEQYSVYSNINLLDAIYDLKTLEVLRSCCKYYVHGHSAGGTNPSLVEAMFFAKPIFCYDVIYNRETTRNKAIYFSSVQQLRNQLNEPTSIYIFSGKSMRNIAIKYYCWNIIVKKYEALFV